MISVRIFGFFLAISLLWTSVAFAQLPSFNPSPGAVGCGGNPNMVPASPGSTICVPTSQATGLTDAEPVSVIASVLSVILSIVGAVSVLMIVIGGVYYVTSAGDSDRVSTARNIVLYAVVGLIIALLAWVVVNTVVGGLGQGQGFLIFCT